MGLSLGVDVIGVVMIIVILGVLGIVFLGVFFFGVYLDFSFRWFIVVFYYSGFVVFYGFSGS